MKRLTITHWILILLMVAAVLDGLLAGGNVDRAIIAMPAWQRVGAVAWAQFSRYADLGAGQVFYPVMAIGATVTIVAAALLCVGKGFAPGGVRFRTWLAAGLMVVALPFSFKAAPFMLSIRTIDPADGVALGHAFSGFEFWGRLQGFFHLASFLATLWAIVAVARLAPGGKELTR